MTSSAFVCNIRNTCSVYLASCTFVFEVPSHTHKMKTTPNVFIVGDTCRGDAEVIVKEIEDGTPLSRLGTMRGLIRLSNKYFSSEIRLHVGHTQDAVQRATVTSAHGVVIVATPPAKNHRQYFNEVLTRASSHICQRTRKRISIHDSCIEMRMLVLVFPDGFGDRDQVVRDFQSLCLDHNFEIVERDEPSGKLVFQGHAEVPKGSLANRVEVEYRGSSRILECIHETNWMNVEGEDTEILPTYMLFVEDEGRLHDVITRFRMVLGMLVGQLETHNDLGLSVPCIGSFKVMFPPSKRPKRWRSCSSVFVVAVCTGVCDVKRDDWVIGVGMWSWGDQSSLRRHSATEGATLIVENFASAEVTYEDALWALSTSFNTTPPNVVIESGSLRGIDFIDSGNAWSESDGFLGWAHVAETLEMEIEVWLSKHCEELPQSANQALIIHNPRQVAALQEWLTHPQFIVDATIQPQQVHLLSKYFKLNERNPISILEMSEVQYERIVFRNKWRTNLDAIYNWFFTDKKDEMQPELPSSECLPFRFVCSVAPSSERWVQQYVIPFVQGADVDCAPSVVVVSSPEYDGAVFVPRRDAPDGVIPFVCTVDGADSDAIGILQEELMSAPWLTDGTSHQQPISGNPMQVAPTVEASKNMTAPTATCELPPYIFVNPTSLKSECLPLNPFIRPIAETSNLLAALHNRGIFTFPDDDEMGTKVVHAVVDFELKRALDRFHLEHYLDDAFLGEKMKEVRSQGERLGNAERHRQAAILAEVMGELALNDH